MSVNINSDSAFIPAVNFTEVELDPSAPGSGHALLYVKDGVVYLRRTTGDPLAVGGVVALPDGRLAIGDASGELSALALGSEGQVVTADASGKAAWATPAAMVGGRALLDSVTVPAGGQATVTFSDIDQGYDWLMLEVFCRTESAAAWFLPLNLICNGSSNADYDYAIHPAQGYQMAASMAANQTAAVVGYVLGTSCTAGLRSWVRLEIASYNDASTPTVWNGWCFLPLTRASTDLNNCGLFGQYFPNTAVTSLTLSVSGGADFTEGSIFKLYGILAA